jgi:hypothetical protein
VLLVLLVVGSGYLGWVWAPIYFDHYAVKQIVADYMNQAVKNTDDAAQRRAMVERIRAVASVSVLDQNGQTQKLPAIPVEEQAITWERDGTAKSLHVAFEYEREVVYPLLDRRVFTTFAIDRTSDLTVPDWGLAR